MRNVFIQLCLLVGTVCTFYSQEISVIPKPQLLQQKTGNFVIDQNTGIQLKGASEKDVQLFLTQLRKASGYALSVKNGKENPKFSCKGGLICVGMFEITKKKNSKCRF